MVLSYWAKERIKLCNTIKAHVVVTLTIIYSIIIIIVIMMKIFYVSVTSPGMKLRPALGL